MALQKSKTLANGATGNYWKISDIQVDKAKLKAYFTISLYTNQTIADTAAKSLGLSYKFNGVFTKAQLATDLSGLGYVTIKAQVAAGAPAHAINTPKQAYIDLASATDV